MYGQGQKTWDDSFVSQELEQTYNAIPAEAVVRNTSYYLRARHKPEQYKNLKFLDVGCGRGVHTAWLSRMGVKTTGIDISENAIRLAKLFLDDQGLPSNDLHHADIVDMPFADNSFDGAVESCVIQHVPDENLAKVFSELHRVLKPGGVFVGYMLDRGCTVFSSAPSSNGTVDLSDTSKPNYYLANVGHTHFFSEEDLRTGLSAFTTVDLSKVEYMLPHEEALRRGHEAYKQSMWSVYAIK